MLLQEKKQLSTDNMDNSGKSTILLYDHTFFCDHKIKNFNQADYSTSFLA